MRRLCKPSSESVGMSEFDRQCLVRLTGYPFPQGTKYQASDGGRCQVTWQWKRLLACFLHLDSLEWEDFGNGLITATNDL
jgi:hypothetical protein